MRRPPPYNTPFLPSEQHVCRRKGAETCKQILLQHNKAASFSFFFPVFNLFILIKHSDQGYLNEPRKSLWLNSRLSRTEISLSVPWPSLRAFHQGQDCCHVSTAGCARTPVTSCTAPSPPAHTRHMQQPHGTRMLRIPSHSEKSAFLLQCSCISTGIEPSGCVRCRPRVLLPAGAQELLPGAWCPPATHAACPPVQTAPAPSPWHSTGRQVCPPRGSVPPASQRAQMLLAALRQRRPLIAA